MQNSEHNSKAQESPQKRDNVSVVFPELEIINFPEHYTYSLVESKETKEVFYMHVTGGYTAFIERIACDWQEGVNPPETRSIIELIIDGFTRRFDYEIQINKPYIFDPPLVAKNYIRWKITNNDIPHTLNGEQKTGGHYFGVLCDGCLAKPKTY
jgi:hypothetical protein